MNITFEGMNSGELKLYNMLKQDESDKFMVIPNMMFNKKDEGSNQIDLLVICSKGIFVFEMKDFKGWIFGNEYNKEWVQVLRGKGKSSKKYSFKSPIKQNENHIKTITGLLAENNMNLPIYNIVVFGEEAILKKVEVTSEVILLEDARKVIDKYPEIVISIEELDNIHTYLLSKNIIDTESRDNHITYASSFNNKKNKRVKQNIKGSNAPENHGTNSNKYYDELFTTPLTRFNTLATILIALLAVTFLNKGFISFSLCLMAMLLIIKIPIKKYIPWLIVLTVTLLITLNVGDYITNLDMDNQVTDTSMSNKLLISDVPKELSRQIEIEISNDDGVVISDTIGDTSSIIEAKVEPDIEMVDEPEVEIVDEPEVEIVDEPEVEIVDEPEVEIVVEPEVEIVDEPEVEVVVEPEVEIVVEVEPDLIEIDTSVFFIGSNQAKVVEILGESSTIDSRNPNIWSYGSSKIYFDENGNVIGYTNTSNGFKGYMPEIDINAPVIFIGSSKEDVLIKAGAPSAIDQRYPDTWNYGSSRIYFDEKGNVKGYTNSLSSLKNYLPVKDINAPVIFIGSSKEEVLIKAGAPSSIDSRYPDTWNYGSGKIYFDENGNVKSYTNTLSSLKNYLPIKDINAPVIFIGSSKEEVLIKAGAPSSIDSRYPDTWNYGSGKIYFDENGNVKSYTNTLSSLKNYLPIKDINAPAIFIGSSKEDVLKRAGAPSSYDSNYPDIWNYGSSKIYFNSQGNINSYSNKFSSLTNFLPSKSITSDLIVVGITKEEVLNIQGAPSLINVETPEIWYYNGSYIKFEKGVVLEWKNSYNTLKVE